MSSLSTSLFIASQALNADTGAIQSINNNIANANTPGYSREVVELQSVAPTSNEPASPGGGVILEGFQSVRNEVLQSQINEETQSQSDANAQLNTLNQIQPIFTTSSQDVGTEITAFFNSLSTLSTNPTSTADRQAVMTAGSNLANAFNTASNSLTALVPGLNTQVTQDVSQINQLTQQIAALNPQIAALKAQGQDGGTLQDQQDQLIQNLSQLTGVSVTKTESGVTLTTGNGSPLVVGSQSFALQTSTGSGGNVEVLDSNGNDITSTIQGGDLGGTIQSRDQTIPGLLNQLDTLAYQFASSVNSVSSQGYDQNGNAGGNFFNIPATANGAAASISLAITNPTQIAASSDGTSGSNGNLNNLIALQNSNLPSGQSPIDAYSNIVFQVGNLASNANAQSNATSSTLVQLNDQRNSISGVSIDQETTNLLNYQQAYAAAARVVTTVQALFQVTMAMGTASAD